MAAHVRAMLGAASARRRDLRLRQQHPRAGGEGRRRRRVRDSRLRAGVHPAAVLRGQGTVPLGRALGRSGRHRRDRRARARDVRRQRARCAAGFAWPPSASRFRDCPRASSGSATASARGSGWRSTISCAAASSRRRSSSAAIIWTPDRSPRPTARPRTCATAATRSRTGPCSTRY